jgi:hypothetical protein
MVRRFLVFGALIGLAGAAFAQQQFKITVTNIGMDTVLTGQTATGGQPLSPVFVSVSNSAFDIFDLGGIASNGIKKIAEGGDTTPLATFANSQLGGSVLSTTVLGGAPFTPGGSVSGLVTADAGHDLLSFAMMLGHTNDSFLGESVTSMPIHLLGGGTPLNTTIAIFGTRAWDAGTELNTQNAADLGFLGGSGNPDDTDARIRVSSGVVSGVGDSWQKMENWALTDELATIQIQSVPEPTTMAIIGLGALALIKRRRNG